MMFCLVIERPPSTPLFPYTPLFQSRHRTTRSDPRAGAALAALARAAGAAHRVAARDDLELLERLAGALGDRSEEHTSELQSRQYLVCRLLLQKKKRAGYPPDQRNLR